MNSKFENSIKNFGKISVLVVGDLMLDKYIFGDVERISPEAPIPVVAVNGESYAPGGAANVANNIVVLGARASLFGFIGDDSAGEFLVSELKKRKISSEGVVKNKKMPTTQKIRVIARHQQLIRLDYEKIDISEDKELYKKIESALEEADIVVISDYAKGVITPKLMEIVKDSCSKKNKKIIVDPKPVHKSLYKDVYMVTPNKKEAEELCGLKIKNEEDIQIAGKKLMSELNCSVLITLGEQGMSLFEKGRPYVHLENKPREVYDVSGAGDTVVAVLALCIASGLSIRESAEIANDAAGIVVGKLGTATVSQNELISFLQKQEV